MSKQRVSNTQLKSLLANLETAALADHPLSQMFREFIKDALLDLRDLRGREAWLEWVARQRISSIEDSQKHATELYINLGLDKPKLTKEQLFNVANTLVSVLDWGKKIPDDNVEKYAIAPLTGKEK